MLKNDQYADPAQYQRDSLSCEQSAAITYPFAQVVTSSPGTYIGGTNTNCSSGSYGSVNCFSSAPVYTPGTVSTVDGNRENRENFYNSCLSAMGYSRVFIPNQPPNKAQRPRTAQTQQAQPLSTPASQAGNGEACEATTDCQQGLSCRSVSGGGAVCRW
jgi:hypothetical protein